MTYPSTSNANGIWTLRDVFLARRADIWPRKPGLPTDLAAVVGNTSVYLTWSAPSATYGTVTDYIVEYTPAGGSPTVILTGSTAESYTVTGLTNNTQYTFRVAAVSYTRGLWSTPISATPQVAWNISSASFVADLAVADSVPTGITFKPDGAKMYHIGTGSDLVREFDLSTPWDITSASFLQSFSVNAQEITPQAVAFSSDGLKMFIVGNASDAIQEYDLATAWDVASASHSQSFSVSSQDGNPVGIAFSANGDKMFIAGIDGDDINEYALSTAWDISTASYVQNFSILSEEGIVNGVAFSVDGSKMFIVGVSGDEVNEYALSTAWDISTASYVQNFSVASEDNTPRDLAFSVDGLHMYIVGDQNNKVYEYSLS